MGIESAVQLLMEVGLEVLGLRLRGRRRAKGRWRDVRLRFLLDCEMLLLILEVVCCVSIQLWVLLLLLLISPEVVSSGGSVVLLWEERAKMRLRLRLLLVECGESLVDTEASPVLVSGARRVRSPLW
jgi:hypothetical protein